MKNSCMFAVYYNTNTLNMIDIQNIQFGYPGKSLIFQDLSFRIKPGSFVGLLGSNGAGKSSLLKLISGLVFPRYGAIRVNDAIPERREPSFLQTIFFVPEEVDTPSAHVIDFANDLRGFYPNFSMDLFRKLLHEFDVPLNKFKELSFGQKKKAWIALGIAARTRVLILDEPTNGLDIPSKKEFRKLLAGSVGEGCSVIISTHQVRDLENLIDHIMIVDEGQLILYATTHAITKKLSFKRYRSQSETPTHIYAEHSLMGTIAVLPKEENEEEQILDIELLYNACIANPGAVKQLFKS